MWKFQNISVAQILSEIRSKTANFTILKALNIEFDELFCHFEGQKPFRGSEIAQIADFEL